jgi:hypothetical protein
MLNALEIASLKIQIVNILFKEEKQLLIDISVCLQIIMYKMMIQTHRCNE